MPVPTDAPFPQDLDLPDGYIVRFAALDPTSGAPVAPVVVSDVSIFGTTPLGGAGAGTVGPFLLVPGPGA